MHVLCKTKVKISFLSLLKNYKMVDTGVLSGSDVMWMCSEEIVPSAYHPFYERLTSTASEDKPVSDYIEE